jgi:uncharacterized damage-inducible protein DinB
VKTGTKGALRMVPAAAPRSRAAMRKGAATASPAERYAASLRATGRLDPEIRDYVEKIDRYRAGRDPIRLMRTGPAKIARAIRGLRTEQLRKRPARGKWCIAEILGHLVDTEVVYGYRYRLALSQPGSPIQGYDQHTWTEALRHARRHPSRMMEQIQMLRRVNLDLVESMPRKTWERYGRHTERGNESVRRTLELIAGHDLNHLDQILAIRKKYGW